MRIWWNGGPWSGMSGLERFVICFEVERRLKALRVGVCWVQCTPWAWDLISIEDIDDYE